MNKVAIVGKPNVGKSTLFNRLIRNRKAIVADLPGVTRDRLYGTAEWLNKKFNLIDTGGLTVKDEPFQKNINQQVNYAIEESQLILFVVSNKEGINADDYYIAKLLKKDKKRKILLVVNKVDSQEQTIEQNERQYYSLGFGKPLYISSEHGIGIGDLLDQIIKLINVDEDDKKPTDRLCFCIIGKPNAGKSTLVNSITNSDRVLVSPIPNTTRDSVDCDFSYNGKKYTIIDTAGIRRSGKIDELVEKIAVIRAKDAISRSNIILLMIDGSVEITEQDEVIGGLCYEANMPTIIVVNKWDLVEKDSTTINKMEKLIRQRFKYLSWAPIIFISAKNKARLDTIFKTIERIEKQLNTKVNTSLLNDVVLRAASHNPASLFKGGRLNISYATQVEGQNPTFVIFTNNPKYLHFSYARFMENTIREAFGITEVPITVYYKDKNSRIRGIKENEHE